MKAIQLSHDTMSDAEGVAAHLGISAEHLIRETVGALIADLKRQVEYLEGRSSRAQANQAAGNRALALLEEGIPQELKDVELNRKALAALIKKQHATLGHNQKLLHEVLGFRVNN